MYSLLKGVRLIEGSAFVAAPLGGMSLAQLGADVIRFEQLGGGNEQMLKQVSASYWQRDVPGHAPITLCKFMAVMAMHRNILYRVFYAMLGY